MRIGWMVFCLCFLIGELFAQGPNSEVIEDRFTYSYGLLLGEELKTLGLSSQQVQKESIIAGIEAFMQKNTTMTPAKAQQTIELQKSAFKLASNTAEFKEIFGEERQKAFAYAYGVVIGASWQQCNLSMNELLVEDFEEGLMAALTNTKLLLTKEKAAEEVRIKFKEIEGHKAAVQLSANDQFMQQLKQKPRMIALESGICYEVLREGQGKQVSNMASPITIHYHGMLVSGAVFDSSVERGVPHTLALNGAIAGWQELIPLMEEGEKIRAYIPPHLAYGKLKRKGVPANSIVVFEMELIHVQ